jgi:hypothetical protein
MKLLKKSQTPVETPTVSLADRIRETCAEAEAYIESRVDALKASDEGRTLPRTWLDLNLRATTRGGGCNCKVALRLLKDAENG